MKNKISLILVLSLLILPLYVQAENYTIVWDPDRIELKGFPGTSNIVEATFTANQDLSDIELWIVSELGQFIEVDPNHFATVKADVPYSVQLFLSLPSYTAFGGYEGTLHIREGKRTLPQSLKISLFVEVPTAEIIPETIALPSSDRIIGDPETGNEFVKDEIVLCFVPGTSEETVSVTIESISGVLLGSVPDLNLYQVQVSVNDTEELNQIIEQLEMMPAVSFATHHWLYETQKVPENDPEFPVNSWDEANPEGNNWGQEMIRLPSAWEEHTGKQSLKIAIVDTGCDDGHEDLADNIFDYKGLQYIQRPPYLPPSTSEKVVTHGTNVAGIIGAQANNGKGIAGVLWDCSMMIYGAGYYVFFKVRDDPDGYEVIFDKVLYDPMKAASHMISAIKEAGKDNSLKVINYSLGVTKPCKNEEEAYEVSKVERAVINWAKRNGYDVLFVFGAGNHGVDAKLTPPANLAEYYDNVITVAAVESNGFLAQFSNFGSGVTVAAPGSRIYTTFPGDDYDWDSGTSLAAPFATGLAGLIWSINIDHIFTACQVKKYIEAGAKIGSKKVDNQPFYIINAYESLRLASNFNPTTNVNPQSAPRGTQFHLECSGFTPSTELKVYMKKPDGKIYTISSFFTDDEGNESDILDSTSYSEEKYEVWALDECAGNIKSNTFTFSVTCPPPSTPSDPSPSNGATGISVNSDLDWSDSSGAASYDVYFGTSTSPPKVGTVASSSYEPGKLDLNTTYCWKIVAKNECGEAPGAEWNFTTQAGPIYISSSISTDTTWTLENSPYVIYDDGGGSYDFLKIAEGATLTIEAGVIVKFVNPGFKVYGTIKAQGTANKPIVFTNWNDDSYGGDVFGGEDDSAFCQENPEDSKCPQPGAWGAIWFTETSTDSVFDNVVLRYAGAPNRPFSAAVPYRSARAAIRVEKTSITIKNSIIEHNFSRGLLLINSPNTIIEDSVFRNHLKYDPWYRGHSSTKSVALYIEGGNSEIRGSTFENNITGIFTVGNQPIIENNSFSNNSYPIWVVGSYPQFSGNQIESNRWDGIVLDWTTLNRDYTLSANSPFINYNYQRDGLIISQGITLTLAPGTIIKTAHRTGSLRIDGTLIAEGTENKPIVFTAFYDDEYGGDTNGDGDWAEYCRIKDPDDNTYRDCPEAGEWGQIIFTSTSTNSSLKHVILRYGGREWAGAPVHSRADYVLKIEGSDLTLADSIVEDNTGGFELTNSNSLIVRTTFRDHRYSMPFSSFVSTALSLDSSNPTIDSCIFSNNRRGIYVGSGSAIIRDSSFHDNSEYGVYNVSPINVDARYNWWGSPTGPRHPTNPGGTGDRVSDRVDFIPWLDYSPL